MAKASAGKAKAKGKPTGEAKAKAAPRAASNGATKAVTAEEAVARPTRRQLLATPIEAITLSPSTTVGELVEQYKRASIQARALGRCASVWENMITDKARPTIIVGLTGALIAGGLRKVLRDMVAYGFVDAVVSTGAILYQDFYQAMGYKHYVGDVNADNVALHENFIDRIYDTYVDEDKFRVLDHDIGALAARLPQRAMSSRQFLHEMGRIAHAKDPGGSLLAACHERGVPMFCPAIADSSIGIGLTVYHQAHRRKEPRLRIDTLQDTYELTQIKGKSPKTGVIYVGGGVPKNYINDVEVIAEELGFDVAGHEYALQITADAPHWGGLSGSTLEEAQSWGKIHAAATKATAYGEATLLLPLLVGNLLAKGLHRKRKRVRYRWDADELVDIDHV